MRTTRLFTICLYRGPAWPSQGSLLAPWRCRKADLLWTDKHEWKHYLLTVKILFQLRIQVFPVGCNLVISQSCLNTSSALTVWTYLCLTQGVQSFERQRRYWGVTIGRALVQDVCTYLHLTLWTYLCLTQGVQSFERQRRYWGVTLSRALVEDLWQDGQDVLAILLPSVSR